MVEVDPVAEEAAFPIFAIGSLYTQIYRKGLCSQIRPLDGSDVVGGFEVIQ